jgi:hypothetical protein
MSYVDTLLSSYYNEMVIPDGYSGGSEYDVAREEVLSCTDALLNYLNSGAGHAYFGAYDDADPLEDPDVSAMGHVEDDLETADVAKQITEAETKRLETERSESEEERAEVKEAAASSGHARKKKSKSKKHRKGAGVELKETKPCDGLPEDAQKRCVDAAYDGLEKHPPTDAEEMLEHTKGPKQANLDARRELDDQNLAAHYWRVKKGGVDLALMEQVKTAIAAKDANALQTAYTALRGQLPTATRAELETLLASAKGYIDTLRTEIANSVDDAAKKLLRPLNSHTTFYRDSVERALKNLDEAERLAKRTPEEIAAAEAAKAAKVAEAAKAQKDAFDTVMSPKIAQMNELSQRLEAVVAAPASSGDLLAVVQNINRLINEIRSIVRTAPKEEAENAAKILASAEALAAGARRHLSDTIGRERANAKAAADAKDAADAKAAAIAKIAADARAKLAADTMATAMATVEAKAEPKVALDPTVKNFTPSKATVEAIARNAMTRGIARTAADRKMDRDIVADRAARTARIAAADAAAAMDLEFSKDVAVRVAKKIVNTLYYDIMVFGLVPLKDIELGMRVHTEFKNLSKKQRKQVSKYVLKASDNIMHGTSTLEAFDFAEDDIDFEDDLQDDAEDEQLYRQLRELAERKKRLNTTDPGTIAMRQDVALGAGDTPSSVFAMFQSKR